MNIDFTRTRNLHVQIVKHLSTSFKITERMPEQVFAPAVREWAFCEFEQLFSIPGWQVMQELTRRQNDAAILFGILDPDPESYYWDQWKYYGTANIPVTALADDYLELLARSPQDSFADAAIYNAEVIACTSLGGGWGVWGQRDLGIAIIGTCDHELEAVQQLELDMRWFSLEEAINDLVALNFVNQAVPEDVEQRLRSNYS